MTTILSTRPAAESRPPSERDGLAARLIELGYRVLAVPAVGLEPAANGGPLDDAAGGIAAYHWAVVTSATGARALLAAIERAGADPNAVRWAVVGPATARVLAERGLTPAAMPETARGSAIAAAMARAVGLTAAPAHAAPLPAPLPAPAHPAPALGGTRVLLARADAADPDLPRLLRAGGAAVDEVVAYHTVEGPEASRGPMCEALADPDLAAVVLASGSAIRGLVGLASGAPAAAARLRELALVSIGPSTSAAIRACGFDVGAEAASPSTEALVEAVRSVASPPAPAAATVELHR